MGMFDTVQSEVPLPDGYTGELQTKSFDCVLTTILIRADLKLAKRKFCFHAGLPSQPGG